MSLIHKESLVKLVQQSSRNAQLVAKSSVTSMGQQPVITGASLASATPYKSTTMTKSPLRQNNLSKFTAVPPRHNINNKPDEINKFELEKKANLGAMIETLKAAIPNILEKSLDKSLISPDIFFRFCPSHFDEDYLPSLKGPVTYYATCKALQLFVSSIILSPKVKLHIQSIRIHTGPDAQSMFDDTTKIIVRWSTCPEGCYHLEGGEDEQSHSTSQANLGAHSWSKLDTMRLLNQNHVDSKVSLATTLTKLPATLIGLTKENKKLERVISGLFIFELTDDNSQVLVHTIEDMDIIERFAPDDVDSLTPC
ncbi:uncharacterized protein SPAPADRAFT_63178 [Spathaspora passalidarum NRRL Y-27907]|uniref:Uncharacterized protein n=1 Tax=Spathaspora passalidarum (strain NRRL Y-27907 / 11-Y1) TaxID=619300 RepID=G3ATU6_SPAPN|nr:uncharacterized protein SPAPADRAFT_63178 [Spathaspora passalidarum NRRL Y-27907]EGW30322.1 hypothetical protein SPAPADRAFT_63178 [Spathaspora passalidarum NRRL Y-27907]